MCARPRAHARGRERKVLKAIVIGGGIIGCSVAWRLAAEGVATTVLERGRVGQEASWAAAGMIAPQAEADGPGPFFDFCMKARDAFEAIVDRLVREGGVDPEYDRAGILYVALDADERVQLERRARWQRGVGATVEELSGAEARRLEPMLSPEAIYAIHMPTNRRTDNRKLTQAYAAAARRAGAEFVEGARVEALALRGGRASGEVTRADGVVMDDGSTREADVVVNAAGSWAGEIRGLEADRVKYIPCAAKIVCFEVAPGTTIGPALFSLRGYRGAAARRTPARGLDHGGGRLQQERHAGRDWRRSRTARPRSCPRSAPPLSRGLGRLASRHSRPHARTRLLAERVERAMGRRPLSEAASCSPQSPAIDRRQFGKGAPPCGRIGRRFRRAFQRA